MKHYRIVKFISKTLVLTGLICIISVLSSFCFYQLGSKTNPASAATDCSNMPRVQDISSDMNRTFVLVFEQNKTGVDVKYTGDVFLNDGSKISNIISGTISPNGQEIKQFQVGTLGEHTLSITLTTDECVLNHTEKIISKDFSTTHFSSAELAMNNGIKATADDPVSFSIKNPNEDPIYCDIELSNGAGSWKKIYARNKIDATSERSFSVSANQYTDRIDKLGLRTIRITAYPNLESDADSINQVQKSFNLVSGSETVSDGTVVNPPAANNNYAPAGNAQNAEDIKPSDIVEVGDWLDRFVDFSLYLLGFVAFVGIVYGGIQYINSSGEPDKAAKAKKTLIYSIIGIILITLSIVIVNVSLDIVNLNATP